VSAYMWVDLPPALFRTRLVVDSEIRLIGFAALPVSRLLDGSVRDASRRVANFRLFAKDVGRVGAS
jgi:hypothetical protein